MPDGIALEIILKVKIFKRSKDQSTVCLQTDVSRGRGCTQPLWAQQQGPRRAEQCWWAGQGPNRHPNRGRQVPVPEPGVVKQGKASCVSHVPDLCSSASAGCWAAPGVGQEPSPRFIVSPFWCSWRTVISSFMYEMVDIFNIKLA